MFMYRWLLAPVMVVVVWDGRYERELNYMGETFAQCE